MKGDTGGLLFRNQGRLSEIQRSRGQTTSLKGGLAFNTTTHPYDGAMPGAEAGYETGTSVFDPVLCELIYRWFCPQGGTVLDPFSGGSVRGIVAAKLGLRYVGIDLSERQIIANRRQAEDICAGGLMPEWRVGNSVQIKEIAGDVEADLIFSCPPFWNLEVYSDDPDDISNMVYADFVVMYRSIISGATSLLKNNRFACFVTGDVRNKDGFLVGLPNDTVRAFQDAGTGYYNDAILVTSTGSLPIRAGRQFASGRKLGRSHQYVQFFVKGSWSEAARACGDLT